jgi:Tfp pilus assembly major pilin PilA
VTRRRGRSHKQLSDIIIIIIIIVIIIIIIKYYAGDLFEKNEMGRAYSSISERRGV